MRPTVAGTVARELGVILVFLALSLFAVRPLASDLSNHTLDGPDPAIYTWTVHWLSGHLLRPGELFEGNVYHPTPHAAILSDLAFGTALLVAPLRPFVRDPVALYNVGVVLTLAFGAWAFYRLVYGLTGSAAASLLTGTLAAFGSHQLLHVYQLALVNVGWLALLLLALHRTFEAPTRWVSALMLGVAFAINVLSSGYFAVAGTLLALVWAGSSWRRLRAPEVWRACGGAMVVAALLLLPYVRAFAWLQDNQGIERSLEVNLDQSFHPGRDLTSAAYLYRGWLGAGGERLFPGIACLLLAAWACVRRARASAFYLASIVVLLLVSLGPEVEIAGRTVALPYGVLFRTRPFNAMMHPYSFAAVARFCLCVLAGLGFAALMPRGGGGPVAAALLITAFEVAGPGAALRSVPSGIPSVYAALDALPPGPILEVPLESPDALIWAARHGRPVLNGAGAMAPPDHDHLEQWIHRDWVRPSGQGHVPDVDQTRALRQLLRMPVRYVIIRAEPRPELRGLQDGFERSRWFVRVAGAPGLDAAYRRIDDAAP